MGMSGMFKHSKQQGFTIIELMVTLLIAAIVLAFATPSFRSAIQNSKIKSKVNSFSAAITYAQNEARKSQSTAFLCGTSDEVNCNSSDFSDGWLVFVDLNGDNAPGGTVNGVPENRRVGQQIDLESISLYGGSSATSLSFDRNGMIDNEVTFILCDDREEIEARALVVNISGQPRLAVDEDATADSIVNAHDGSNVVCI